MDFVSGFLSFLSERGSDVRHIPLESWFSPRELQLLELVRSSKSEREIAKVLCNQKVTGTTYKDLRRSVQSKCCDVLISARIKKNRFATAQAEITKMQAALRTMKRLSMRQAVAPLAFRLYRTSVTYQQSHPAFEAAQWLCRHYSMFDFDAAKAAKYRAAASKYKQLSDFEDFAFSQISQAYFLAHEQKLSGAKLVKAVKELADRVLRELPEGTYVGRANYFTLRSLQYELAKDYPAMITLVKSAIEEFRNLSFRHSAIISIYTSKLVRALVSNGDLAKADVVLDMIVNDTASHKISYTYAALQQTRLRLLLAKPESALQSISLIPTTKLRMYEDVRKHIVLYQFYANIVLGNFDQIRLKSVKTHLTIYQDGNHVKYASVLIGELLYYIGIGDADKIIDRGEALYMYTRNKLEKDGRTAVFIKNLINLCKGRQDLAPLPRQVGPTDEAEIMPFEYLESFAKKQILENYRVL